MKNTRNRIIKKSLKIIENDLDRIFQEQGSIKAKSNPIFDGFEETFIKELEANEAYIKRLNNSIRSTKK